MSSVQRLDRLSALVARFALDVTPDTHGQANLVICQAADADRPGQVLFAPAGHLDETDYTPSEAVFLATALWGGAASRPR